MIKSELEEAGFLIVFMPLFFTLFHYIDGSRPFVTEFEVGAISGVVLLKLVDALQVWFGKIRS